MTDIFNSVNVDVYINSIRKYINWSWYNETCLKRSLGRTELCL